MSGGAAFRSADATVSAYDARAVTPSDSTILPTTRALYIGGSGDVSVVMAYGTTVTFTALLAGSILPVQVKQVRATNTTATNLIALY